MNYYEAHHYSVTAQKIVETGKTELYLADGLQQAVGSCLYTHRLHNGNARLSPGPYMQVIDCPSCNQIAVVRSRRYEQVTA